MDTRKLIKFGKDSFVISIPKTWIKANNLSKGSSLFVKQNTEGHLTISASPQKKTKAIKKITIETDDKSLNAIKREVIAAYLNHYNIIEIKNKNIGNLTEDIRKILHELVALEIMGENKQKIIARDFLRLDSLSVRNSIRRIDLLIKSMFMDVKDLKTNADLKSIVQRDTDINRLYFLGYRATTQIISNQEVMQEFKLTPTQVMGFWKIMVDLEKISDEIRTIAQLLHKIKPKENKQIVEIIDSIEKQYKTAIKAFSTNDLILAGKALELKKPITERCEKEMDSCSKDSIRIFEIMRQTAKIIHHIPRVLINSEDVVSTQK